MCYMDDVERDHGDGASSIGVRFLRQNLSVYLQRVKQGEELVVTERGVPVARLMPLAPPSGVLGQMLASGVVRPRRGSLSDIEPLDVSGANLSEVLREMRDDERW